jgi:hypothetical protein
MAELLGRIFCHEPSVLHPHPGAVVAVKAFIEEVVGSLFAIDVTREIDFEVACLRGLLPLLVPTTKDEPFGKVNCGLVGVTARATVARGSAHDAQWFDLTAMAFPPFRMAPDGVVRRGSDMPSGLWEPVQA